MTDRTPTGDPHPFGPVDRSWPIADEDVSPADRTPTGDLRERLAEALHQHTIATGLPTPFPPDFPEDPWLEAARRADQSRADAVLPVVEAETAAKDREIERLRGLLDLAEAAAPATNALAKRQRERAEEAERQRDEALAAVQRVRDLAEAALEGWKPDCEYHRERADRKGYSHDEAAADALGRAIEAVTEMRAALDQPKETS